MGYLVTMVPRRYILLGTGECRRARVCVDYDYHLMRRPDTHAIACSGAQGGVPGIGVLEVLEEKDIEKYWLSRPHCVATLMVVLAQPRTRAARSLLEALLNTEESQTIEDAANCMEELLYSDAIPGNVMGMELLWTAEAEKGFEREDILTFRRLERLYPELWPERIKAEKLAKEEEQRRMEEEEVRKKKEYSELLRQVKEGARSALGDTKFNL
jgi:hypothetical protein